MCAFIELSSVHIENALNKIHVVLATQQKRAHS